MKFKTVAAHDQKQDEVIQFFVNCLAVRLNENLFCAPDTTADRRKFDPLREWQRSRLSGSQNEMTR